MSTVDSTSDGRTVNNTLRHKYRVLSDAEKAQMQAIKDKGQEFLDLIDSLRSPEVQVGPDDETIEGFPMMCRTFDRELAIATERVEEAVMWAVKHITA
jgi:molecular chaperone GrpE (heat shock protein)